MSIDRVVTQEEFGAMVGVSQQAVSDMLAAGVLQRGDTAAVWLLTYCEHLREVAAGRDPSGELSAQRARLAKEQADRTALQNQVTRREFAPVGLLEVVLSDVARQISTRLDSLLPQIKRISPDLSPTTERAIVECVVACRNLCAATRLADAEKIQSGDDDTGPQEDDA